jgi:hypothetical protein
MIITIIEAKVLPDKWISLEAAYKSKIHHAPPQLRETFLLHDRTDTDIWRIISIWRSIEAYKEISNNPIYETCMQVFRSVGAVPTRRICDVPSHHVQI